MPKLWRKNKIHRHIGGLEIAYNIGIKGLKIHRHIGGLEMASSACLFHSLIHRHIGGLEKAHRGSTA